MGIVEYILWWLLLGLVCVGVDLCCVDFVWVVGGGDVVVFVLLENCLYVVVFVVYGDYVVVM